MFQHGLELIVLVIIWPNAGKDLPCVTTVGAVVVLGVSNLLGATLLTSYEAPDRAISRNIP